MFDDSCATILSLSLEYYEPKIKNAIDVFMETSS